MTFDDGILKIYQITNTAAAGAKPVTALTLRSQHYYHVDALGYGRFYTAMQAKEQIDTVVSIPEHITMAYTDIIVLDGSTAQYRVSLIQPLYDEDNLRITKLTLGRLGESYEISNNDAE